MLNLADHYDVVIAGGGLAGKCLALQLTRRRPELSILVADKGLFTFVRWGSFMCNPPLCITEEQLREGFAIIDAGLNITDEAFEG